MATGCYGDTRLGFNHHSYRTDFKINCRTTITHANNNSSSSNAYAITYQHVDYAFADLHTHDDCQPNTYTYQYAKPNSDQYTSGSYLA